MDFSKLPTPAGDSPEGSDNELDEALPYVENGDDDEDLVEDADDDDQDEEENEALIIEDINRLQEELSHNPYDYDKHVMLISKFRLIGELDYLREAREKMNQYYPLAPHIWLDWIEDETNIATTGEQKSHILALYERAIAEYFDLTLWTKFVQHSTEMNEEGLLLEDDLRKILERALNQAGCCVNGGALLWRYYRLFESSLLASFDSLTDENSEQVNLYIANIFGLYHRQFSIPLMDMEEDYEHFEEWLEEINVKYGNDLNQQNAQEVALVRSDYQKSHTILQKLHEYEAALLSSDAPHYEEYLNYIDFEIENDNLARTQNIFERAITDNCLQSDLWLKYLKFCDGKFVVDDLLIPIYERATQNCSWISEIWVQYLLACERLDQGEDLEKLADKMWHIYDQAVIKSFSSLEDYKKLFLTYLNFRRRKACKSNAWSDEEQMKSIRELIENTIKTILEISTLDYCYDFYRYWAKLEAKYCKNMENARNIFKDLVNKSPTMKRQATVWLDFAHLELRYGEEDEYRKILHKGLALCSDYPESIGDELMKFEQEDSDSIEQYDISLAKYEAALLKINDKRLKEDEKAKFTEETNTQQTSKPLKRKAESDESTPAKKSKDSTVKEKSQNRKKASHGSTVKSDESKREQTLFVKNLSYDLSEDEIRQEFLQFGDINEVRLTRNFRGDSKGFAYVEFASVDSVHKALLHDRMLIRGRPAYLDEMDNPTKFSFSTSKEKNKLFVKNIPFDMTKEDLLQKVFADYADSIVNIRLVTFRNGHSKGLAYVEMKNEDIAEKAVRDKNNFKIGDRELFVAISDPSLAKAKSSVANKAPAAKGVGASSSLMIPHALMTKNLVPTPRLRMQLDSSRTNVAAAPPPSNSPESNPEVKNLKNDQFRSMFLS